MLCIEWNKGKEYIFETYCLIQIWHLWIKGISAGIPMTQFLLHASQIFRNVCRIMAWLTDHNSLVFTESFLAACPRHDVCEAVKCQTVQEVPRALPAHFCGCQPQQARLGPPCVCYWLTSAGWALESQPTAISAPPLDQPPPCPAITQTSSYLVSHLSDLWLPRWSGIIG